MIVGRVGLPLKTEGDIHGIFPNKKHLIQMYIRQIGLEHAYRQKTAPFLGAVFCLRDYSNPYFTTILRIHTIIGQCKNNGVKEIQYGLVSV